SGVSGPTTTNSTPYLRTACSKPAKSNSRIGRLVASVAVPALPGATNRSPSAGLCRSFQARVCSRAPEPTMRTFTAPFLKTGNASAVLFPLDRAGWLAGHVVDDAVDARHLVGDPVRDAGEYLVGEASPVGR